MFKRAPEIEPRKAAGFFEEVKKIAPYYVPEWRMEGKDASCAFWKVFAHLLVSVVRRLNQAPDKNLLAFLEMLGFNLLPAQPARAPLTFDALRRSRRRASKYRREPRQRREK